ncbi:hypothetical protein [Streptomyces sp. NBC_01198]|uniref:hypothetical protein n=1 Tax=Streptomyces sp. NBC_01198 TaxID=2903769 RepID=UPI002E14CF80|nr:hypothetical protein OG702_12990 [Streptomyces sp. NBC_01198]
MTATQAFGRPLVSLAEVNQDKVTPGLLGFVIFAVLAFGLWMLMKNMGKQMKKIDFEEQPEAGAPERPTADPTTHGS